MTVRHETHPVCPVSSISDRPRVPRTARQSESNPFVPRIVELCTALVEERGLDSEGIYRVPGNNAAIKSLSAAVNRGIHDVDLQVSRRGRERRPWTVGRRPWTVGRRGSLSWER